ncbi:MAG: S26 family signal peptidase [Phycisphaerales bacterium]
MSYLHDHVDRARDLAERPGGPETSIIETLQAIVVAFILAFVFRGFLVEPFVIPTGSMAPTLLGQHLAVAGPETGYRFEVNAVEPGSIGEGASTGPILTLDDPMLSRHDDEDWSEPASFVVAEPRNRMGDRILVLKYLYLLRSPRRFEVAVFKDPLRPDQNFIKRIVGLPGESVWLADGDVFTAESSDGSYQVRRKPERVQRSVWQPVYHSAYSPTRMSASDWGPPWSGSGWTFEPGVGFRLDSAAPSALRYRQDLKPITDETAYNATIPHSDGLARFDVSDIRLAAQVTPSQAGLRWAIRVGARGHEFEARLENGRVALRSRRVVEVDDPSMEAELGSLQEWRELAAEPAPGFEPGETTAVEFWHVDQALYLWIDGWLVAQSAYDWSPDTRLKLATGLAPAEAHDRLDYLNPWAESLRYFPEPAMVSWTFEGSPVTLRHLELDRDLYYQPKVIKSPGIGFEPGLATHPDRRPTLGPDHYFVLGDNSAASSDGRQWTDPAPWVRSAIDDTRGIVPRDLLIGRAFFVYFPSPEGLSERGGRFVPNFGELRFIR